MENFIPFAERGEIWKDVKPLPQFSEKVEILKIDYSQQADEINSYFRAILQSREISKRAFDITTEVINVKIN